MTLHELSKLYPLLFDEADYLKYRFWGAAITARGYVNSNYLNKTIPIHRLITNCPAEFVVDHIDRNPFNNCKDNLRIVTSSINRHNSKVMSNSSTGYTGVFYSKNRNSYRAHLGITISGVRVKLHLGWFKTAELAASAYAKEVNKRKLKDNRDVYK